MRRQCGFTLIEILIVAAIIGIIAAIAVPSLLRARVQAETEETTTDIRSILSADGAVQSYQTIGPREEPPATPDDQQVVRPNGCPVCPPCETGVLK